MNILESLNLIGSWELDLSTKKIIWSAQTYLNYGYEPSTIEPSLEFFFSRLVPKYIPQVQAILQTMTQSKEVHTLQAQIIHKDGHFIDVLLSGRTVYNDKNEAIKIVGTTQDVTQLVHIKKENEELSKLIEISSNEIYIVDIETFSYLYVNQGACDALGYTKEEFYTMNIFDINPKLSQKTAILMRDALKKTKKFTNKTIHKRKDGSLYHAQAFMHTFTYKGKDAYVIFDTDISQNIAAELALKKQQKNLHHQANHDTLTNLPNRALFLDRLQQIILAAKRNKTQFALFFIDLDHFKTINDTLGHAIGDEVLIEATSRLRQCVREEDTIARLGGDEFTVILKDIKTQEDVSKIAQKICTVMRQTITVKSHALYISASIGISLYPQDATERDMLIKYADTAMYKAKDEGRDTFEYYKSSMTQFAFERVVMDASLRVAIKEEQFVVYYQPQVDLKTDTIIGMEALVRWMHPLMGLRPPGKFIPLAEESGLIIEIDKLVMRAAMQQFVAWYKAGFKPGTLSLNLSMKKLNEENCLQELFSIMQELHFQAKWLELEVTETQVMENPELSIQKLQQLSDAGIQIAIDDFGTGYSSLSYLKKLPLDKLKIDQSFVRDLPQDEEDVAITQAIIALGKSLKFHIIAEGVETEAQKEFMIENGCDFMQGYLFSKPIPASEIQKLLKS